MLAHEQTEKRVAGDKQARSKQLIIGLDFGAAFTKVVIGDNRVRYAVPFAEFAHPDNQYLLPSILATDENNRCVLSSDNTDNETANLKFPLLENTYTDDDLLRVSAYLALVLRASRSWLLERYEKRYNRSELIWSINAGLPVDNAGNEKLSVLYQQLLHTAWVISVLPGPISLSRVRQYMKADVSAFDAFPAVYRSKIISKQAINTFPACCAQICGYVHSKQCGDDLHMLIDIGAGTISIATFMVERNDADTNKSQCTLYSCAVEPIGVSYLLKRRHENLKLTDAEINLFKDIPDASVFSQAHDLTEKDIKFADTLYSGDAAKLINKVLDHTKNQHCPDSSYWESGVPTFIYGGGAHMEIVQNIIHSHENKSPPHKIRSIRLNPPEDLMVERLPEDSYDRLSVAYGLAFKVTEIDQAGTEKAVSNIGTASEA